MSPGSNRITSGPMNRKILMLAAIMAAAPGFAAGASVYKWTDDSGVTHFGDRQPNGASAEIVNVRTGKSSGGQASRVSPQQQVQEIQEDRKSTRLNSSHVRI